MEYLVTYDVNTTTNYNAEIEAAAQRPALPEVAAFLGRLLDEETRRPPAEPGWWREQPGRIPDAEAMAERRFG